ncbi:hypothetical protein D3C74_440630 [compost metagenome]
MHQEHDGNGTVRGQHEVQQVDDVRVVGAGHHLGHQRQHAIGGEAQHQGHHPHDDGVGDLHEALEAGEDLGLLAGDAGGREADEDGEDHHGYGGGLA